MEVNVAPNYQNIKWTYQRKNIKKQGREDFKNAGLYKLQHPAH